MSFGGPESAAARLPKPGRVRRRGLPITAPLRGRRAESVRRASNPSSRAGSAARAGRTERVPGRRAATAGRRVRRGRRRSGSAPGSATPAGRGALGAVPLRDGASLWLRRCARFGAARFAPTGALRVSVTRFGSTTRFGAEARFGVPRLGFGAARFGSRLGGRATRCRTPCSDATCGLAFGRHQVPATVISPMRIVGVPIAPPNGR